MDNTIDISKGAFHAVELIKSIHADTNLTKEQKEHLAKFINTPNQLAKLTSEATGAGLGLVISNYLKLSKPAKVLLSVAGYGIGKVLYDAIHNDKKKFQSYNKDLKVYEIK